MARVKIRNIWPFSLFRASLENPSSSLLDALLGPRAKSGAEVTAENVIGMTAMWRAVNILAETIASLPFEIIETTKDGDIQLAKDHDLYNLINSNPNPLYTSFTFRHTLMVHTCMFGNGVCVVDFDTHNRPKKFTIVDSRRVTPFLGEDDQLFYKITGIDKTYPAREIIHIPNLSFNGLAGLDMLATHRDNFGMGLSNRDYMNTYYKKGTMINGWIEWPDVLADEQYKRLKKTFRLEHGGAENAGTTPILEGGAKYHKINADIGDAKSLDTQKLTVEDVSRITGVPLHMLSALDRSTFNNIEVLSLEFAKFTIRPWVKRIEAEFNRKIFREGEKNKFKVRLNMDALLRGDTKSRSKFYRTLWNMGVITINEIRKLEKLNKIQGGDTHFVPLNMAAIDEDGLPVVPVSESELEGVDKLGFETLKAKLDAYGVGVRAGAFTPQEDDEEKLRTEAGLPNMGQDVKKAWIEDEGYRRPITLKLKQEIEQLEEDLEDDRDEDKTQDNDQSYVD